MDIPAYHDMLTVHERIKPYIHCTPVRTSDYLNELAGCRLFFKCDNFQEPGAFKVRGATNAVFGRDDAQAEKGAPHPFLRQPCLLPQLCRHAARHSL